VIGLTILWVGADAASAQSPTEKLGRGLANTFLGILEVPNQMVSTYRENTGKQIVTKSDATVKMLFLGPVRGFREAGKRTAHGIWDTVTFLSPGSDDQNYRSRIRPEYIKETYDW
jgi:putative exosortase-associated protein (TIGR04073 family)